MTRGGRILAVLVAMLLIAGLRVGQQLYRYYVYAEERTAIGRLEREVEEAGLGVIDTQIRAERLRDEIERADRRLSAARDSLERLERRLLRESGTGPVARSYRDDLTVYNTDVGERNALYREWRLVVDSNHQYVHRYNLLADSIRHLATLMGEPYYPVPSPAEIAVRREGVLPD
jgi:hypothetical protein